MQKHIISHSSSVAMTSKRDLFSLFYRDIFLNFSSLHQINVKTITSIFTLQEEYGLKNYEIA